MVHDVDGFLVYKGDGCFRINRKLSRKFNIGEKTTFVLKFDDHGNFCAVRAGRYYNGNTDFDDMFDKLRKLDEFIVGKVRTDDEILHKMIFGKNKPLQEK